MGVEKEYILSKLGEIEILPTFPGVVGEVIKIIEDPMSSATDLARSMDPSMVGEVLRVANTAYFGTKNFRNITSIEHAIAIIGLQHLSTIILQMPFISMIGTGTSFDRKVFIEHSMICAIFSKEVAFLMGTIDAGESYISGMLHDIGAIVIYKYFPDEWKLIEKLREEKDMSRLDAEKEVFSVDHGFIGALLLRTWNIPGTVSDAVMYHHRPEEAGNNKDWAVATSLANRFAKDIKSVDNLVGIGEFINDHKGFIDIMREQGIGIRPGGEMKFFDNVFMQLKGVRSFLGGMRES